MLVQRCEIVYNAPRCASSQQICPPRSFGKAAAARVKLHRVQAAADFGAPAPGADDRLIELVDAGFEDSFDTANRLLDQGLNVDQINKAYGMEKGVIADIVAAWRKYKPGPLEVIKVPDPFAYPGLGDQKQMVIGTYLDKKVLESCGPVAAVEKYLLELFKITAQNGAAYVVYDSRATGRAMMFPVKNAPDLKEMLNEAKLFMVHDPTDQQ